MVVQEPIIDGQEHITTQNHNMLCLSGGYRIYYTSVVNILKWYVAHLQLQCWLVNCFCLAGLIWVKQLYKIAPVSAAWYYYWVFCAGNGLSKAASIVTCWSEDTWVENMTKKCRVEMWEENPKLGKTQIIRQGPRTQSTWKTLVLDSNWGLQR